MMKYLQDIPGLIKTIIAKREYPFQIDFSFANGAGFLYDKSPQKYAMKQTNRK